MKEEVNKSTWHTVGLSSRAPSRWSEGSVPKARAFLELFIGLINRKWIHCQD